jgi:iron complex transport system substrate-binding protein
VSSTSEARPKVSLNHSWTFTLVKCHTQVAFLEWLEPLFDGGHWIPDMLQIAGAHYSLNASGYYSKQMSVPRLEAYDPDIIIIAPCGFDLARAVVDAKAMWRHSWWRRLRAVISMQVYVCDGNAFFARPGPRLVQGTAILAKILHKNIELPRALLSPGSFRQL